MSKKKGKKAGAFRYELEQYQRQGVTLCLNGRISTPKQIVKAHRIAEDGVYMRDYVQNKRGEVERLDFDFVPVNK